jgi:hypothetical protein
MNGLATLTVNPDEGFPQAFLFAFGGATYGFTWYVNVAEYLLPAPRLADPTTFVDLTGDGASVTGGTPNGPDAVPGGILVLAVDRRDPDAVTALLRRRVIPGQKYQAGQLQLVINRAVVALGNLNGVGSFGSVLDVKVGPA